MLISHRAGLQSRPDYLGKGELSKWSTVIKTRREQAGPGPAAAASMHQNTPNTKNLSESVPREDKPLDNLTCAAGTQTADVGGSLEPV